jgi:hypothetical protein
MSIHWNGREVELKEFTIRELAKIREAFSQDAETGMWQVLALTAHYKDDGSRVFDDASIIPDIPAKHIITLTRMANEAMRINGIVDDEKGNGPLP